MNIEQFEKIIEDIRKLPAIPEPEATFFNIGGRGHYENPTTDVLAFFCDSNAAHGMGDLVPQAIFDVLLKENLKEATEQLVWPTDCSLSAPPEREVVTKNGKRIDLLLEGSDWVMLIENKIYHHQNNPFAEYEEYIAINAKTTRDRFNGKQPFLVVLSPDGKAPEGWLGLSYVSLVPALKSSLSDHFMLQPLNKWMVLLRDFLVNLEQIVSHKSAPAETVDYVLRHLNDIHNVQTLKERAVKDLQNQIQSQSHLQSEFEEDIFGKLENWYGYPALRFCLSKYKGSTETVLFLDAREGHDFRLHLYVYKIDRNELRDQADQLLRNPRVEELSTERHETIRGYKEILDSKDIDNLAKAVASSLKRLEKFELNVRLKSDT